MRAPDHRLATIAEVLARPEEDRVELIGGTIVEKASPSGGHSLAQVMLDRSVGLSFHRRGGSSGGPGGWWILLEVDIELGPHDLLRPDLAGWRRERVPECPTGRPVTAHPDWVCEVISPSNRRTDTVDKLRRYHRAGIGHYWLVDPDDQTLTVMRHEPDGYKLALVATNGETVRPEPFDAIELRVGVLFGEEPDDLP